MSAPTLRHAIQLLPPCGTTGIGSLPHTQLELALQMALQVDIPFLPQLPRQDPAEFMIPAALDGLPGLSFDTDGLCTVDLPTWEREKSAYEKKLEGALKSGELTAFEPSISSCRAWRPFLWEAENRKLALCKTQIAGPATVRWVAKTSNGEPVSEHAELDQQIFRLLLARCTAMVKALRRVNATPIVFLDEPGLYALDPRNARHLIVLQELKLLIAGLQKEGALVGLHCCSNTEWGHLLDLGLNILSVDARLSLDALLEDRKKFLRFLETEATLSLGIVPTDVASTYRVQELADSVEASLRATLPASRPFSRVLSQVLLTPACGLAMRSVMDAERIFDEVKEAQGLFRRALSEESPRANA
ncbi:MAG: hypothetical protein ACJ790_03035 [Myxococcaceae bacterium]